MAAKTDAYVDTSAFIAFLDRSDFYHSLFRRLFSQPPALITSSLVVAEGHGWFLRRYDRQRAIQFLNFLDSLPNLTVVSFGAAEAARSTQILKKLSDQTLTLADAHGLALLADRRIRTAWSTDRHLTLTGARLVIENEKC